jgi:hydroxyacylglutathione hydrolase
LVLLAGSGQVQDLVRKLMRIGLDRVVGYIPSLEDYTQSEPGGELETVPQFTAAEVKAKWEKGEVVILDVRGADEYKAAHIPGALNIHAGRVMKNLGRIPKEQPVVLHCLGGDRSSTAISALLAAGYHNVSNLTGGIKAWQEQGFPLEKGEAPQPVGA